MAAAGGRVGRLAAVAGWPVAVCMCSGVAVAVAGWRWLFAWPDGRAMPKLCRARVEPRLASAL